MAFMHNHSSVGCFESLKNIVYKYPLKDVAVVKKLRPSTIIITKNMKSYVYVEFAIGTRLQFKRKTLIRVVVWLNIGDFALNRCLGLKFFW